MSNEVSLILQSVKNVTSAVSTAVAGYHDNKVVKKEHEKLVELALKKYHAQAQIAANGEVFEATMFELERAWKRYQDLSLNPQSEKMAMEIIERLNRKLNRIMEQFDNES